MKITLLPELDEAKQAEVRGWLEATIADPALAQPNVLFPLGEQAAIYVDGRMKVLRRGEHWQDDGVATIYVGYSSSRSRQYMPPLERLAVVGAIISLADLWSEFREAYTARAAALLVSSYEGIMSGLVQTEAAITGLAFNADRSVVAGRIGDCYHLPDGTAVEIDETWTVVPDRPEVRSVAAAG